MRKRILVRGLVLLIVGGIFIVLGVLTGKSETTITKEDILGNISYHYDFLGNHENKTTANLLPGTYELLYNFSSTVTVGEFYVKVLDPDGIEIQSVYSSQNQSTQFIYSRRFETQKTGQHTFTLVGRWISVQVNLYKESQSTKTIYPYEIVLYLGLLLFIGGAVSSIVGALIKEKGQERWIDKL